MVFLVFIGFLYPPPTWKVFLSSQKSSPKDFLSVVVVYAFFLSETPGICCDTCCGTRVPRQGAPAHVCQGRVDGGGLDGQIRANRLRVPELKFLGRIAFRGTQSCELFQVQKPKNMVQKQ